MKRIIYLLIILMACSHAKYRYTIRGQSFENFIMRSKDGKPWIEEKFRTGKEKYWVPLCDWYVIVHYDMNKDNKCDLRKFCEGIFSIEDITTGDYECQWEHNWFREEVDANCDGKFDFYLEYRDGRVIMH